MLQTDFTLPDMPIAGFELWLKKQIYTPLYITLPWGVRSLDLKLHTHTTASAPTVFEIESCDSIISPQRGNIEIPNDPLLGVVIRIELAPGKGGRLAAHLECKPPELEVVYQAIVRAIAVTWSDSGVIVSGRLPFPSGIVESELKSHRLDLEHTFQIRATADEIEQWLKEVILLRSRQPWVANHGYLVVDPLRSRTTLGGASFLEISGIWRSSATSYDLPTIFYQLPAVTQLAISFELRPRGEYLEVYALGFQSDFEDFYHDLITELVNFPSNTSDPATSKSEHTRRSTWLLSSVKTWLNNLLSSRSESTQQSWEQGQPPELPSGVDQETVEQPRRTQSKRGPKATPEERKKEIVQGWFKVEGRQRQEDYCRSTGIAVSTLQRWIRELEESGQL